MFLFLVCYAVLFWGKKWVFVEGMCMLGGVAVV